MKRIICVPVLFLIHMNFCSVWAQTPKITKDYFIVGDDTTYCKELEYGTTAQGYLDELEFVAMDGNKVKLKGKKNVPDVLTFHLNNSNYDKIPFAANKPDSYIRYTERVVDGKLKVYFSQQNTINNGMTVTGSGAGSYRFFLKMPDGIYYNIFDNSNMKKVIRPYLEQCIEFKKAYKGNYSRFEEPFMKMIELYNSLCK